MTVARVESRTLLSPLMTRDTVMGDTLDAERLEATYATGVLTLNIPVAEAAKPRKVPVAAGTDVRTIEAQTTPAKT